MIRSRIATSVFTLPMALALGTLTWILRYWGLFDSGLLTGIALALLTTYGVMEMNNRYMLIRVRTRLSSSMFWIGLALFASLSATDDAQPIFAMCAALCLVLATNLLFNTYNRHEQVVKTFHIYILLGIAALLCPPLAVCVPLFWVYSVVYMRSMTLRCFCASLLGTGLVAVGSAVWAWLDTDYLSYLTQQVSRLSMLGDWALPTSGQVLMLAAGVVAVGSFLMRNYDDKIQARMMNYVLVVQWIVLQLPALFFLCHDGQAHTVGEALIPTVWLFAAPLVAHQFATSRSVLTTIWFLLMMAMIILRAFL